MEKVVLPLLHFGTIDYFIAYYHAKEVLIEAYETFPKQTFRNRTTIQGSLNCLDLSIPIGSKGLAYTAITLPDDKTWVDYYQKCLNASYSKSPYYEFYMPYFDAILTAGYTSLFELNKALFLELLKLLQLKPKHRFTTDYVKVYITHTDLRGLFKPSKNPQLYTQAIYSQVFDDRQAFKPNLSILDLLFNLGPESLLYLRDNAPKPV